MASEGKTGAGESSAKIGVSPAPSPIPSDHPTINLALPKGRMQEGIFQILREAGISVTLGNDRTYRPKFGLAGYEVKLLKPQNILGMLKTGSRDLGFAGADWVRELELTDADVVEVLDTGLDPVRIVAASPHVDILEKGTAVTRGGRRMVVATEYQTITRQWLEDAHIDAEVFRAYGATESLPPEDADMIVDNTATGSTLVANKLEIVATVMQSTTRMYASRKAWDDPDKRKAIEDFALLLKSVLQARNRVMLTFNVSKADHDTVMGALGS